MLAMTIDRNEKSEFCFLVSLSLSFKPLLLHLPRVGCFSLPSHPALFFYIALSNNLSIDLAISIIVYLSPPIERESHNEWMTELIQICTKTSRYSNSNDDSHFNR